MTLVNAAFDGKRFQSWRRSLLIALSAKNKLGFINGSCPAPAIRSNGVLSREQGEDPNNSNYNQILNQHLSKDQFLHLVQLIKHVKVGKSGSSSSEINANVIAGTIIKYSGTCFSVVNTSTGS